MADDVIIGIAAPTYSDFTAKITNKFPQWHVAKRMREATTAKLINSAAALPMESLTTFEIPNLFDQRTLTNASVDPNERAYTISTPAVSLDTTVVPNLVYNSTFINWSNPTRPADGWNLSVEDESLTPAMNLMSLDSSQSYQSGNSLTITSMSKDSLTFGDVQWYQDVSIEEGSENTQWTASVWSKAIGQEIPTEGLVKLFIQLIPVTDALPPIQEINLRTEGNWERNTIRITSSLVLQSIRIGIRMTPETDPDETTSFMAVTSFFLQETHTNNFWSRHAQDKPTFISQPQEGKTVMLTSQFSTKRTAFYEVVDRDLSRYTLPAEAVISFLPIDYTPEQIIAEPIPVLEGTLINDTTVLQGVIIGTPAVAAKYGWGTWSYGKLVKFNLLSTDEVMGVYSPAFPILSGDIPEITSVEAVTSIELQTMTARGDKLWIIAKVKPGSSLVHMSYVSIMLFVIDLALPKVKNTTDNPDVEGQLSFLPVLTTYMFNNSLIGGSYGTDLYGTEEFGGNSVASSIKHIEMHFTRSNQIVTTMESGYTSVIDLQNNYFIDNGEQVVLLRDPREDDFTGEVVVW